jgi:hypothetical protein
LRARICPRTISEYCTHVEPVCTGTGYSLYGFEQPFGNTYTCAHCCQTMTIACPNINKLLLFCNMRFSTKCCQITTTALQRSGIWVNFCFLRSTIGNIACASYIFIGHLRKLINSPILFSNHGVMVLFSVCVILFLHWFFLVVSSFWLWWRHFF